MISNNKLNSLLSKHSAIFINWNPLEKATIAACNTSRAWVRPSVIQWYRYLSAIHVGLYCHWYNHNGYLLDYLRLLNYGPKQVVRRNQMRKEVLVRILEIFCACILHKKAPIVNTWNMLFMIELPVKQNICYSFVGLSILIRINSIHIISQS